MSCGTPIVSTRLGGIPEYVSDDVGMLVDPGDVDAAVDAVRRLAEDPALRDRLGAAGRARAETVYAWEVVGEMMNAGYRKILA